jgi:CYTH domain-containing protein
MDPAETKYTRVEYERRFLVSPQADWRSAVEPYSKVFEDKYLAGTRLRLRIQTDTDTGRRLIKLNKKLESPSPYFRTIGRILLSPGEYEILASASGNALRKIRHYHYHLGQAFSVDRFEGELDGLVLCETEAEGLDELMRIELPAFATREVTEDPFFTGGNLCRTTRADLLRKLAALS